MNQYNVKLTNKGKTEFESIPLTAMNHDSAIDTAKGMSFKFGLKLLYVVRVELISSTYTDLTVR